MFSLRECNFECSFFFFFPNAVILTVIICALKVNFPLAMINGLFRTKQIGIPGRHDKWPRQYLSGARSPSSHVLVNPVAGRKTPVSCRGTTAVPLTTVSRSSARRLAALLIYICYFFFFFYWIILVISLGLTFEKFCGGNSRPGRGWYYTTGERKRRKRNAELETFRVRTF